MDSAIIDEIQFWTRQFMEHCFFLYIGLAENEVDLKQTAQDLQLAWSQFIERQQWTNNELATLITHTRDLKTQILERLENREWIGFLYPSFVRHQIKELDYFDNIISGVMFTREELLAFWNDHNMDYVKLIPHLLDPSEQTLIAQVQQLDSFPVYASDDEMFVDWSIRFAEELNNFQLSSQQILPESVIHPVLLEHQIREVNRGLQVLQVLSQS